MTGKQRPRLLTPAKVAEILDVNRSTVYRLAAEGAFVCCKLGPKSLRITEESLYGWIAQRILEHEEDTGCEVPEHGEGR